MNNKDAAEEVIWVNGFGCRYEFLFIYLYYDYVQLKKKKLSKQC